MFIRRAVAADLSSIEQCAHSAYEKYVALIGRKPAPMVANFGAAIVKGQALVMLDDADVVAFAICYALGDCLQLDNIAVHPEHQSTGNGRYLLEYVHDIAREGGYRAVTLYTNEKMVENLNWYIRRGYQESGRRVVDGFSRVFFEKPV